MKTINTCAYIVIFLVDLSFVNCKVNGLYTGN